MASYKLHSTIVNVAYILYTYTVNYVRCRSLIAWIICGTSNAFQPQCNGYWV